MSRFRSLVALLLLTGLVAAGCSKSSGSTDTSATDEPAAQRSNVQDLRVAVGDDPFMAGNPAATDVGTRANGPNPGIFETLTQISDTYGAEAALALRWESPNPRTWRFFLRKNVSFHNGAPFDSDAVVTNLEAIAHRQTRPRGLDPGTAKATAPDVVEVDLTQDNTLLPEQLANPGYLMIAPGTRAGAGDTPETTPTGTGPFVFVSYTHGTELKMKANPKYWGGAPQLNNLLFRFGPEKDASRLLATRQVEIVGNIAYANMAAVSGRTDKNVASPAATAAYLLLNTGGTDQWTTLKDDNLRKAVAESIDRTDLIKTGFEDHGIASTTLIPSLVLGSDAASRITPPSLNPLDAKKLLDAAGYAAILPGGMRSKDGKPLVLNLLLSKPIDQAKVADTLKAQLAQVGIGVQVQDPGSETPFAVVNDTTFDMFLDVRPQDDANPCALCRFFTLKSGNQYLAYSTAAGGGPKADDTYDRLFSAAAVDTARRSAADIMQIVTDERFTAVPLASLRTEWLTSPRVRGFQPAADGGAQHWEGVYLTV
ncbi:MAG TPA: ABC transporter substrate-binding protein [Acidimicrobiales bacterium]|nr:ABC transporter substrate-binding protein [Acidimicrobiales bacterium]